MLGLLSCFIEDLGLGTFCSNHATMTLFLSNTFGGMQDIQRPVNSEVIQIMALIKYPVPVLNTMLDTLIACSQTPLS